MLMNFWKEFWYFMLKFYCVKILCNMFAQTAIHGVNSCRGFQYLNQANWVISLLKSSFYLVTFYRLWFVGSEVRVVFQAVDAIGSILLKLDMTRVFDKYFFLGWTRDLRTFWLPLHHSCWELDSVLFLFQLEDLFMVLVSVHWNGYEFWNSLLFSHGPIQSSSNTGACFLEQVALLKGDE